ncbi:GntR family transcriptional regulator [Mesorhizobium sp.]|uniref:GntR family transcriptional regulator n=1 Tax=Mesorhizobium sp. TaxID=1871066 RepID=UPI000FE6D24C|nr:GntR family transcriptional regulator [Mesorhizobium sp.]RWI72188.1 MAG: GntR family transcriptional regulator [Mesorhizobium sp.]
MTDSESQFAYERIADMISRDLTGILWRGGDRLPSEVELARHFNVSRRTMRRALAMLEHQGVIEKNRGRHTIYRGRAIDWSHDSVVDFPTAARRAGFRPSTKVLRVREAAAGINEARALGIRLGAPVAEICRLRLLDGTAVAQQRSILPDDIAAGIRASDLEQSSLYDLIRRRGNVGNLFVAAENLSPARATRDEAEFLAVAAGDAVVRIVRIVRDAKRALEFSDSLLLGSQFRL